MRKLSAHPFARAGALFRRAPRAASRRGSRQAAAARLTTSSRDEPRCPEAARARVLLLCLLLLL